MHIRLDIRSTAVTLLAVAAVACGPSAETRRATDSVVAAAAQTKVATQAGEVMSARREAQTYLDSARAAFLAKDAVTAAQQMRNAATFARAQADSVADPAKTTLKASSDELDRLAARVDKKTVTTVKTLDYAFARMQIAEAQFHCVRALDAWKGAKPGATASEIAMLADHFERAAADAGQRLTSNAQQATITARTIAEKLEKGVTVPPADVDNALTAMDTELHTLLKSIANLKG